MEKIEITITKGKFKGFKRIVPIRSINEIALDIKDNWKPISLYAKPYWDAMICLNKITDRYFMDDGISVVLYFLSNATHWTGLEATFIKEELKFHLKEYANNKISMNSKIEKICE